MNDNKENPPMMWKWILGGIVICSFILDLVVFFRYSISYGQDGPFYDNQIRAVLETGLPSTNDPPLIYYIFALFTLISGSSFVGIKLAMSLFCSLIAIPTFYLISAFLERENYHSKGPALVGAALMVFNFDYFRMIGDLYQNVLGCLFLLSFFYFVAKWFEDFKKRIKEGILALLFVILSLLTHIYVGAVALAIFGALIIFYMPAKWIKTRQTPVHELKIFGILLILLVVGIIGLKFVVPTIYAYFYGRIVGYIAEFWSALTNFTEMQQSTSYLLTYLTIPYMFGVGALIKELYVYLQKGVGKVPALTKSDSVRSAKINIPLIPQSLSIAWIETALAALLFFLVLIPTGWQMRFSLMAFVPIALISPICLKYLDIWFRQKNPTKESLRKWVVGAVSVSFVFFSLLNVFVYIPSMGPSITTEQYLELEQMDQVIGDELDPNGQIFVNDHSLPQWVEYVFDRKTTPSTSTSVNLSDSRYQGLEIYEITLLQSVKGAFKGNTFSLWNPFTPMTSDPSVGFNAVSMVNADEINCLDTHSVMQGIFPPPNGNNPPHPPPGNNTILNVQIPGSVLFKGEYFALSCVKFENGTIPAG